MSDRVEMTSGGVRRVIGPEPIFGHTLGLAPTYYSGAQPAPRSLAEEEADAAAVRFAITHMTSRVRWKVGDVLKGHGVTREIVEVRPTGYSWVYPDMPNHPDGPWISENSTDPFLEMGWTR